MPKVTHSFANSRLNFCIQDYFWTSDGIQPTPFGINLRQSHGAHRPKGKFIANAAQGR